MLGVKMLRYLVRWKFLLKFVFLITTDILHGKNFRLKRYFCLMQDFTQICHFDHHWHVGSQNVRLFFRYLVPCKVFTQICHLWPPRTCCMAKFQNSEMFLPKTRFYSKALKLVIFDHHGHVKWQNPSNNWCNARFYSNLTYFTCTEYVAC